MPVAVAIITRACNIC